MLTESDMNLLKKVDSYIPEYSSQDENLECS